MKLLVDLLNPTIRAWVYAVLIAANGGVIVYEAAEELPLWALVTIGAINGAGFSLARANTPR